MLLWTATCLSSERLRWRREARQYFIRSVPRREPRIKTLRFLQGAPRPISQPSLFSGKIREAKSDGTQGAEETENTALSSVMVDRLSFFYFCVCVLACRIFDSIIIDFPFWFTYPALCRQHAATADLGTTSAVYHPCCTSLFTTALIRRSF